MRSLQAGIVAGGWLSYQLQHIMVAHAFGAAGSSMAGRLGAVVFGVILLFVFMAIARRWCAPSFFHGFVVASGLFLSFDIVVFHWIFRLHRITNGPEADVLEPVFVFSGIVLIWLGLARERKTRSKGAGADGLPL